MIPASAATGTNDLNSLELFEATTDELPVIMDIERGRGFEKLVSRSSEAEHQALMDDPQNKYVVFRNDDGAIGGFALLTGMGAPEGSVLLKRIALRNPGKGYGRNFLTALVDRVFSDPCHHRFWLDVFEHNERARRACQAAGFVQEGILRDSHVMAKGQRVSLVVMSVLRRDWLTAFI